MHLLVYPQFFLPKLKIEMSLDIFNRVSFFFLFHHPQPLAQHVMFQNQKKIRHPEYCNIVIPNIVILLSKILLYCHSEYCHSVIPNSIRNLFLKIILHKINCLPFFQFCSPFCYKTYISP